MASGGSRNFEKGEEDKVSAPSSFIANAYNELCAFYTGRRRLIEKKSEPNGGGRGDPTVPLNSPLIMALFASGISIVQLHKICCSKMDRALFC